MPNLIPGLRILGSNTHKKIILQIFDGHFFEWKSYRIHTDDFLPLDSVVWVQHIIWIYICQRTELMFYGLIYVIKKGWSIEAIGRCLVSCFNILFGCALLPIMFRAASSHLGKFLDLLGLLLCNNNNMKYTRVRNYWGS